MRTGATSRHATRVRNSSRVSVSIGGGGAGASFTSAGAVSAGFLTAFVTFCAFAPLRAVSFANCLAAKFFASASTSSAGAP